MKLLTFIAPDTMAAMARPVKVGFYVLLATCAVVDVAVLTSTFSLLALILCPLLLLLGFLFVLVGVTGHETSRAPTHPPSPLQRSTRVVLATTLAVLVWLNIRPRRESFHPYWWPDGGEYTTVSFGWPFHIFEFGSGAAKQGVENLARAGDSGLWLLLVYLDVTHRLLILIGAPLIWEGLFLRRKYPEGDSQ